MYCKEKLHYLMTTHSCLVHKNKGPFSEKLSVNRPEINQRILFSQKKIIIVNLKANGCGSGQKCTWVQKEIIKVSQREIHYWPPSYARHPARETHKQLAESIPGKDCYKNILHFRLVP